MTGEDQILGRLDHIDEQLAELRTAITGNEPMGHKGIVQRLEAVETMHAEVPEVHHGIEARAKEGRSALWNRIERLEKRWAFTVGVGAGSGLIGGGFGAWLANQLPLG